jgi:hypothetical protein
MLVRMCTCAQHRVPFWQRLLRLCLSLPPPPTILPPRTNYQFHGTGVNDSVVREFHDALNK